MGDARIRHPISFYPTPAGTPAPIAPPPPQSDSDEGLGSWLSGASSGIVDDDQESPGAVIFDHASPAVDEDAGTATLTLVRTGGASGIVEVTVESSGGSATAGADYTPLLTTVTVADGDTGPYEVIVPIVDDRIIEADETVTFTLSGPTGQIGQPDSATLTIRDNDQDQANTVQFAAAEFVAAEAQQRASITISRHGDVSGPASVRLVTRDGTAVAGEDYEALDVVVGFAAGEASLDVDVVILADSQAEADETLTFELSARSGLGLGMPAIAELVISEGSTAWGAWQPEVEIDAAAGAAYSAQVAFDDAGNALSIWVQEGASPGGMDVWANYYQAGVGWGMAEVVQPGDASQSADTWSVQFDAAGNALAVWIRADAGGGGPSVWAGRFEPDSGWEAPVLLETDPGEVYGSVALAVHGSGDAAAVWAQFDGTHTNIHVSRYTAGAGWGAAEIIDDGNDLVGSPHVAVAPNGDILAVWRQPSTGIVWDIWARRYTQAGGWEPAVRVSTTNTGRATAATAAFDGTGNAIVLWLQDPGFNRSLYAARHSAAGGWSTPQLIDSGGVDQHRLAVDAAGNALAIWRRPEEIDGKVVLKAFASRFTPAGGWEAPQDVSVGDVFVPVAALRPDGHGLAVWQELDASSSPPGSTYSIWSSRYTAGGGWDIPEQIGSGPHLAVGPNGEAFAIWTRGGGVWVNRFE